MILDGRLALEQDGQNQRLLIGGLELANQVAASSWDAESFQASVCGCGYEGCARGGWLCWRRAGDYVLLVPDYSGREDHFDEYRPPQLYSETGPIAFRRNTYQASFQALVPLARPFEQMDALTTHDLARMVQHEAPLGLLGEFPVPPTLQPAAGVIVGSSEGSPDQDLRLLEKTLKEAFESSHEATLLPLSPSDTKIEFYLDSTVARAWTPLVKKGNQAHLLMSDQLIATF